MFGSTIVYTGLLIAFAGLIFVAKPIRRLHVIARREGLIILGVGVGIAAIGLNLPATETRVGRVDSKLDQFVPVWEFNERHTIDVDASPAQVFAAIRRVRPNEISLFRA